MMIFQPYLPHIITNNRRPLHDLSHSKIILWKPRFPYQHVTLKHWPPTQWTQTPLSVEACIKHSLISCLHYFIHYKPDIAAIVAAAAMVECALNLVVLIPASYGNIYVSRLTVVSRAAKQSRTRDTTVCYT